MRRFCLKVVQHSATIRVLFALAVIAVAAVALGAPATALAGGLDSFGP